MAQAPTSRRETIRQAAAQWVVRLSDPDYGHDERADFEKWRDADPAHDAAYERELAAWRQFDRLRAYRALGAGPDPDILKPARPVRRPAYWPRWAAAAAVVATIGLGAAFGLSTWAAPAYATSVGERRLIVLSDGTRLELNTDSRAVVRYRRGLREIQLVRGEAAFDVAKDRRPFIIRTREGRLAADEGEFAVRVTAPGAATVTVREGRVSASGPGSRALSTMGPTQTGLMADGRTQVRTVGVIEVERTLAWRQGAIVLDGRSLAEAAAEFNRYSPQKITLADKATASLRLGGYFRTSDSAGFVKAVTEAFPVTAETGPDGDIRLRARP